MSEAVATAAWLCLLFGIGVAAYTYFGYPALLYLVGLARRRGISVKGEVSWPTVSISIPAFNEEDTIGATLDSLLELDYPSDLLQILVVSDASTDRTDEIVEGYADRGVELLRVSQRAGKTAAENAAATHLTGEIVVNTDATIRIPPQSLKPLIEAFADPEVGVASGRDISVARVDDPTVLGEAGYVGYEMWVRDLETRAGGIIGASGCFYAIRAHLHKTYLPNSLSRDFAASLIAKEKGYRAVSVRDAICYVPRTTDLRREYRRKVRTMVRGLETLTFKRHLLNPFRHGTFAWMLFSHKVCRWSVPWCLLLAALGLGALSVTTVWLRWVFGTGALLGAASSIEWTERFGGRTPRLVSLTAFAIAGNVAAMHSTIKVLRGERAAMWEPTRRKVLHPR